MAYTNFEGVDSLTLRDQENAAANPKQYADRVLYSQAGADDSDRNGPSDEDICSGKKGYHWNSKTNTCVKDEEAAVPGKDDTGKDDKTKKLGSEYTTEETCRANGGIWEDGACQMYEKPKPYTYEQATPKVDPQVSETKRLEVKQKLGSPIAESVKSTMQGEVAGLGEQWRQLEDMDAQRLLNEDMTKKAQEFAAKGMSFSSPMLAEQKDTLREYAKQRQMTQDQADALQMKLNVQALKNAEPIDQLAVSGRLGALEDSPFVPGKIPKNLYLDPQFGLKDPEGFSGLPTEWPGKEMGEEAGPQDDDPYTDDYGLKCTVGELDEFRRCPDNPNYETGAEGADPDPESTVESDPGGSVGGGPGEL